MHVRILQGYEWMRRTAAYGRGGGLDKEYMESSDRDDVSAFVALLVRA